ncbi:MAG TPA: glycosyltransferase [Thermoanaerobaculia bacterium]|jgi:phosphatidylinositol alpha-1,6-mannosyltransferase|nr:glycosyltransferase [Thermoanaerobaculia bacterium]
MAIFQGVRTPKGAEPARASRLLFVSAGLSPRSGGIAKAGRLLLDATRQWAAGRGASLRLLTLGGEEDLLQGVDGEAFAGNRNALARALWSAQLLEGYGHQVYDFLGVARIQGVLPARLRARYLLYLYGLECWRPLHGSRRRALDGAATRLACSAYTIERLRRHNPHAPPVEPLHLALGEAAPADGAPDDTLLRDLGDRFLLIVGRLAPGERYKGHDELLAALAALAPRYAHLKLAVVGEGADRPRLEERARALGIAGRVRFTGFVDDATLAALYERCNLFAMPSDGEGFGFVYLEAMRAGKPCIARQDSAAAEIVVDGETGRLIGAGVEPLAAAIAELLAGPARAAAMGAAGRARWQGEFRPARFAASLRPHLDALVASAQQPAGSRALRRARPLPAREP